MVRVMDGNSNPPHRGKPNRLLLVIGFFKIAKGTLLVAVGFGALHFLHKDVAESLSHWAALLQADPEGRYMHRILAHLGRVDDHQLEKVCVAAFIYAALFFAEGIGLLQRKLWGEYLTIVITASLIPLELYEIAKHVTLLKIVVVGVNVVIVAYLIYRVRTDTREPAS